MGLAENRRTDRETEPQPGNILAVHFKLYGGDGISLQSQELHTVLRNRLWNVFECCSDLPTNKPGLLLSEISYQTDEVRNLRERIFNPNSLGNEDSLLSLLEYKAKEIRDKVEIYLDQNNIRIVHAHNIFSLPFNPAATLAFYNLARERADIRFVAQHHDLINEGRQDVFKRSPYSKIADLMDKAILPNLPNIQHVVLSSNAARQMKEERGIDAVVIPDGFDFDLDPGKYPNADNFRNRFKISEDDLVIGVMTRIVPRKSIEFAIQLARIMADKRKTLEDKDGGIGPHKRKFNPSSRIVLLLAQKEDTRDNIDYYEKLREYAKQMGVEIIDVGKYVVMDDLIGSSSSDIYPFYGIYQHLDILCYPTTQEGFGNQLLEGIVLARKLVPVIFEYPVYREEIARYVPNIVSLGSSYEPHDKYLSLKRIKDDIISDAVNRTIDYLLHPDTASQHAEENFLFAKARYDIRLVAKAFTQLYGS